MSQEKLILVTGVTGYIGGCLVPRLLEKGYRVRILVREPRRLSGRKWLQQVEMVEGNILSEERLNQAMQGVSTAYYFVHQMTSGRNYFEKEIEAACLFCSAASSHSLEQIIYLGGLAEPEGDIGQHLRSRIQTGDTLRQGSVPVTEFRASLIIGSGSISFEMIRYLTEQFPIVIGPPWLQNLTQPISIQDVLAYLLAAMEDQNARGKIYEIGGKDSLTYAEVITTYAHLRRLKRRVFSIKGMPVSLMAEIAGRLTPIPASVAGPLLGGMRSDSLVQSESAKLDFPAIQPISYEASILQALESLSPARLESGWENEAASFRIMREGFFIEGQQTQLEVPAQTAYQVISNLGGKNGWFALNGFWKLRGLVDRLAGGAGMRGRDRMGSFVEGDVVDFYRVEALEEQKLVRLRAEVKAPGTGWMEWRIQEQAAGSICLRQIAYFAPRGTGGFLYWYLLLPFHRLVFSRLFKAIARKATDDKEMKKEYLFKGESNDD